MAVVWVHPALPCPLFTSILLRVSLRRSCTLPVLFYLFSSENSLWFPSTRVRCLRYSNYRAIENNTYWLLHSVWLSWRSSMFSHWASPLLRTPGLVCSQGHSIIFLAIFCKAREVPAVALSVLTKQSIFSTLNSNMAFMHTRRGLLQYVKEKGTVWRLCQAGKFLKELYVRQCANGQNRSLEYWLLEVE